MFIKIMDFIGEIIGDNLPKQPIRDIYYYYYYNYFYFYTKHYTGIFY
jgi:hypothetical protein